MYIHGTITYTLQYVINCLFQTLEYVKGDLIGELRESRGSDEEIEELMEAGGDEQQRIEDLAASLKATQQALDIVMSMTGYGGGSSKKQL